MFITGINNLDVYSIQFTTISSVKNIYLLSKACIEILTTSTYCSGLKCIEKAYNNGNILIIKLLLNDYLYKINIENFTMLCKYGHLETLKFVFNNFIKIRTRYKSVKIFMKSAIDSAIEHGHKNAVELLTEKDGQTNFNNVISLAAEHGHSEIVKFCLTYFCTIE